MRPELRFKGVDIADDTQVLGDKVSLSCGRVAEWRGESWGEDDMRGSRRADRRHKGLENFVGGKQYFEIHLGVH